MLLNPPCVSPQPKNLKNSTLQTNKGRYPRVPCSTPSGRSAGAPHAGQIYKRHILIKMAKRTFSRAFKKKRITRKRRRFGNKVFKRWAAKVPKTVRQNVAVTAGLGFPKRMTMTHKYCEKLTLNTGAGGIITYYNFNANSVYDPNSTGTGHQPMYFDQLMAIYDHYCVIGSKITVKVVKTDSAVAAPSTWGIYINDDSTGAADLKAALEQTSGKHKVITVSEPRCILTHKWSAKKAFGGSVLANTELQGTASANPTEYQCYTLWVDSSTSATQTTHEIDVEIEYIVVYKELKDIGSS